MPKPTPPRHLSTLPYLWFNPAPGGERESPGKKDLLPAIAPKKGRHAGNRSPKKTLRQESSGKNDIRSNNAGPNDPGRRLHAAFVAPSTTLVKSPSPPYSLAAKRLRRGAAAARIPGGNPRAGRREKKRESVAQKAYGALKRDRNGSLQEITSVARMASIQGYGRGDEYGRVGPGQSR